MELKYTWRFPFALSVSHNGHQHILHTPADLPDFCTALNLGQKDLPEWYSDFLLTPPKRNPPRSPFSTLDKRQSKRSKHGRGGGSKAGTPRMQAEAFGDQDD